MLLCNYSIHVFCITRKSVISLVFRIVWRTRFQVLDAIHFVLSRPVGYTWIWPRGIDLHPSQALSRCSQSSDCQRREADRSLARQSWSTMSSTEGSVLHQLPRSASSVPSQMLYLGCPCSPRKVCRGRALRSAACCPRMWSWWARRSGWRQVFWCRQLQVSRVSPD